MHEGRTYIVTGASSGIGAITLRVLKSHGAQVIGLDLNECKEADIFYKVDLSDPQSIDEVADQLPSKVDGLANIAGVPPTLGSEQVLKVNLIGLRRLTLRTVGKLADGASIVNLASLAGFGWSEAMDQVREALALDFNSDLGAFAAKHNLSDTGRSYFLSKEALVVWTMQNRWTWRDRGIRMNAVSPGPVATPILQDFVATLGRRADEDMRVMDRPGIPEEIAPVVSFMLSEGSAWMRGSNVAVDGGMSSYLLSNNFDF